MYKSPIFTATVHSATKHRFAAGNVCVGFCFQYMAPLLEVFVGNFHGQLQSQALVTPLFLTKVGVAFVLVCGYKLCSEIANVC